MASVVCSATTVPFVVSAWKTNCFPQTISSKVNEYLHLVENSLEIEILMKFYVNYFLWYHFIKLHQSIVERVNGAVEWAHRAYQLLSASYQTPLYKHMLQDERQPLTYGHM